MQRKRCFFIGHREAPHTLLPMLRASIEQHIKEYGVSEFVVGRYGDFDRMAARCVMEARSEHPEIMLTCLLPYHPSQRKVLLPEGFSGTLYPPGQETVPHHAAIIRANQYMVDHADYLIAYVWHAASNARNLLDYAEYREKTGKIKVTRLLCP